MTITVGIKALNEERKIAAAIASAQAAVAPFGGTVILADSGSADATVAIARAAGVRVVQLANVEERCCGAGAQLAFQFANSDYFCLIDGDMELDPGFLGAALAALEAHPGVAGVGGHVIERNMTSSEFQIRVAAMAREPHRRPGPVDRLEGGGLYRTAAIRDVGYYADRNLHSFEEFELAARLATRGWTLMRIDHVAAEHEGYTEGYALLPRRVRSRYVDGAGETLRAAIGHDHLRFVFTRLGHVRHSAVIVLWWAVLVAAALTHPLLLLALFAAPMVLLGWRRRSLRLGVYNVLMWNVLAFGTLRGLFRRRVSPALPLNAVEYAPRARDRAHAA